MLVFGLDVLGNPFGLISGITTGAKNFFYEPYQVTKRLNPGNLCFGYQISRSLYPVILTIICSKYSHSRDVRNNN